MWIYDNKLMYSIRLDTENSRIYSTSFVETLHEQNFMIAKYDKERLPSPDIMGVLYKFPPKFVKPLKIVNLYVMFEGTINEFVQFVPRLKKYFSLFVVLDVYIFNIDFMSIVMDSFDAKRFILISQQERTMLSRIPYTIRRSLEIHQKIISNLSIYL